MIVAAAHTGGVHYAVGIGVTVASALLYNVGFVLEKHGLTALPDVHARRLGHLLRSVASSPAWLAGFVSMLAGLALQILALSVVPISVVQPIFVSGIVLLLVLAHLALGEHLGRRDWAGVGVVAVALLFISLSLDPRNDHAGTRGTFTGIIGIGVPTAVVAVWLFLTADRLGHADGHTRMHLRAPLYGMASGLVYGVASLATKAVSAQMEKGGIFHALPHVLASPYVYLLGVSSAGGLVLFQTALQRCHASVVVPVSNVISSAYVVAVGTVLFGDHLPDTGWRVALRLVGFAGVLGGMVLLAGARSVADTYPPLYTEPEPVGAD
ncbi:MAG TPA: DMT family transporter [Acidimicrobiales bacterium]|nr:DMT family transporter [Acidimicrobiales bacterium]